MAPAPTSRTTPSSRPVARSRPAAPSRTAALSAALGLLALGLFLVPGASALEMDREYGASSFKFLKLPLSPRIVALGGAGAALADGAGDLDLNPAAPAYDSAAVVAGKGYPFAEFEAGSSHITWSVPYGGHRVLVNARYLGFDKIDGYDDLARATTPYGAHTLKGQLGMAGRGRILGWGATVNFAENSVAGANYRTAMVNAGARVRILDGLHAGLSVLNADFWGSEARVEGYEDPFPPTAIQAGLAYAISLGGNLRAAVAVDARTRNDEKLCWPMGAELSWNDVLHVRGGFPVAEPEPALATGVGLSWSMFRFDYAYQGHETLGPGHFFSLGIRY